MTQPTRSHSLRFSRVLRSPAARLIGAGLVGAGIVGGGLYLWDQQQRSAFRKTQLENRSVLCQFSTGDGSVTGATTANTSNLSWNGSVGQACKSAVSNYLREWSPFRQDYKPLVEGTTPYNIKAVNSKGEEYKLDFTTEEAYGLSRGRARVNRPPIDANLFGEKMAQPRAMTSPSPSVQPSPTGNK